MSKDTFYFSHDYNARNDDKIKRLIRKHGFLGYGIFWAIVEDLYNNANALQLDCEGIAFDMRTNEDVINSIIFDFDLFVIDGKEFGSISIEKRLNARNDKSTKARESALARWNKLKNDANALRTHCEGNAIKERKGKEIKVNNIEDRKIRFKETLNPFVEKYSISMLKNFYTYWTEPNPSNTKFRKENEKFWDLSKRLATWHSRNKQEPETTITRPKIATFEEFNKPIR